MFVGEEEMRELERERDKEQRDDERECLWERKK